MRRIFGKNDKSIPFNGGFTNFKKNIHDWEESKRRFIEQLKVKNSKIDSVEISTTTVNHQQAPWANIAMDNFPTERYLVLYNNFYISNILINKDTVHSLLPNRMLDDNVINAFFKVSQYGTGEKDFLIFELHFLYQC